MCTVCVALGFAGICWLSVTSSIENLILNAAALAFVLDLDELVFSTMCAENVKAMLRHMAPMKTKKNMLWHGLNPTPLLVFASALAVAFACQSTWIGDMTEMMRAVKYEMCLRGDLGFVVDVNPELGYAVVGGTHSETAYEATEAERRASKSSMIDAMLELDGKSLLLDVTMSFVNDPICSTCQNSTKSPAIYVQRQSDFVATKNRRPDGDGIPGCIDVYNYTTAVNTKLSGNAAIVLGVQAATGMHGATCQEFFKAGWCDDRTVGPVVRSACSKTCGCGDPYSGLLDFTGCIPPRLDNVKAALSARESCDDMPVAELAITPGIHRYLRLYNEYYAGKAGQAIDLAMFAKHGCSLFARGSRAYKEAFTPATQTLATTACGLTPQGAASDLLLFETIRAFCPVAC